MIRWGEGERRKKKKKKKTKRERVLVSLRSIKVLLCSNPIYNKYYL